MATPFDFHGLPSRAGNRYDNYENTFSPIVRITSVRLILAIVTHMDVKTTFFNGELDEKIYMNQPLCFESKGQERKVCKLKRSIYGLKQASRQ